MCLPSEPCQRSAKETVLFYWLCKSSCSQALDCLNQNNPGLHCFIRIQQRYESLRSTQALRVQCPTLWDQQHWKQPKGRLGAAAPLLPPASMAFPIPPTEILPLVIPVILRHSWEQALLHSASASGYERTAVQPRKHPKLNITPPKTSPCPCRCVLFEILVWKRNQLHPFKAQALRINTWCLPMLLHLG